MDYKGSLVPKLTLWLIKFLSIVYERAFLNFWSDNGKLLLLKVIYPIDVGAPSP